MEGRVVADRDATANGMIHDCRIVRSANGGFNEVALLVARGCVYRATSPGAVPLGRHEFTLTWQASRWA